MLAEDLDYERFEQRFKDKVRIGAGGFGTVYKVFDHAKNHYVALKVSPVKPEFQKFTLKNEVELVNKMEKHRNIARYDACYRYNTGIAGEMDFAILKFYEDGNLEQFLLKTNLGLNEKRLLVEGILRGVQFLHRNEVIHRDLKAQNILMSREDGVWCPKITDFGLSREVGGSETITNSAVGISYAYAAPEQILNQKIYKNVDIWAIGVMIYRIIAGDLPFKGFDEASDTDAQSQFELSKKIVNVQLPAAFDTMPEPYKSMVGACLVKDPKERAQGVETLLDILNGRVKNSEPEPAASQPPKFVDDATQIIGSAPPSQADLNVPSYSPEPVPEPTAYQQPERNVTQYVPPKPSAPEPEEVKSKVEEPEGGEKKGFNYRYLIILIVLILTTAGILFAFFGLDSFKKAPLEQYSGPLVPEEQPAENFEDYDLSANEASDPNLVAETISDIDRELSAGGNDNNYRLNYLKAKLFVYQDKPRETFNELEIAKQIALTSGKSAELKSDMEEDENVFAAFTNESAAARKRWDRIIEQL